MVFDKKEYMIQYNKTSQGIKKGANSPFRWCI